MNIMKQMYNEGDDEMKRTISKAWHESQEKRAREGDLWRNFLFFFFFLPCCVLLHVLCYMCCCINFVIINACMLIQINAHAWIALQISNYYIFQLQWHMQSLYSQVTLCFADSNPAQEFMSDSAPKYILRNDSDQWRFTTVTTYNEQSWLLYCGFWQLHVNNFSIQYFTVYLQQRQVTRWWRIDPCMYEKESCTPWVTCMTKNSLRLDQLG